jgi:hypothetical protein
MRMAAFGPGEYSKPSVAILEEASPDVEDPVYNRVDSDDRL